MNSRKWLIVWTLRRGVLAPPEPLPDEDAMRADLSMQAEEAIKSDSSMPWLAETKPPTEQSFF